jgi:hypothetical protein
LVQDLGLDENLKALKAQAPQLDIGQEDLAILDEMLSQLP